jgi:SynChlorMet cassette protein ScmC
MTPHHNTCISRSRQSDILDLLSELTGLPEPEGQLRGFSLRLGDDSRWWVASFPWLDDWVKKVAAIMHLPEEKPDDANLIAFLEGQTSTEKVQQLVAPDSGWRVDNVDYPKMSLWHRMDSPDLLAEVKSPVSAVLKCIIFRLALHFIYRESILRGGLPFHAALVEHRGKGYLLAAPSNTGKSTCCRRLSPPWLARGDDEALVVLVPDGRYLAHPFPTWSDCVAGRESSYTTQDSSFLAGVFFFEQASTDEYYPIKLSQAAVEAIISAQVTLSTYLWNCNPEEGRRIRRAIFNNAFALFKKVPAFRLRVSLTGSFWELLDAAVESR